MNGVFYRLSPTHIPQLWQVLTGSRLLLCVVRWGWGGWLVFEMQEGGRELGGQEEEEGEGKWARSQ